MTSFRKLITLVAIIVLVAAACGNNDSVETSAADDGTRASLTGRWVLARIDVDGADMPLPSGDALEMTIEAGRISGSGGCNSFGGTIDASADGSLTLVDLAWTEMACEEIERMDFESTYLGALSAVNRWEADPEGITVRSGTVTLRYTPGADPVDLALEGTTWHFDTIFSGQGATGTASSTDQSQPQVELLIVEGTATLTADGCDDIVFDLDHEGGTEGNLNLADPSQLELAGCDASNMADAVDGFAAATGYTVDENRLKVIGSNGELIGFRGDA